MSRKAPKNVGNLSYVLVATPTGFKAVKKDGKAGREAMKNLPNSLEQVSTNLSKYSKSAQDQIKANYKTSLDESISNISDSVQQQRMSDLRDKWFESMGEEPPSGSTPETRARVAETFKRTQETVKRIKEKREAEARGGAGESEEEREAKGAEDEDEPTRMVVREDEVLPSTPSELKAYIGTGDGVDERIRELHQRYKDNGMGGTFEKLATEYEAGVRQAMLQDGVPMEGEEAVKAPPSIPSLAGAQGSLTEPSTSVPPSIPSRGLTSGTPSGFTPSESSVSGSSGFTPSESTFSGSSFTGSSFPSSVGPPAGGPPPVGPPPAGGAPAGGGGIGGHEAMEEKQGDEAVEEEDNAIKALKKSDTVMDDSFNISKIGRDSPDELNKHQVIYRKLIETLFVSHSYIRLENRMVQRPELIQMLNSDKEIELYNRAVKMVRIYADHLAIENPRYGIDAGVSILKQQLIELYTCCYHVRKNLGRSDKKSALDSYNRVGVIVSASSMGLTLDSLLQWAQNNRSTAGDTSGLANQRLKKPLQNMNNSELSQDKSRRTIGDIFNGRVSGVTHSDKPYLLGGNNQHMGQNDEEGGSKFRRSILIPEHKSNGDNLRWKNFNWRMAKSKKFQRKKIC